MADENPADELKAVQSLSTAFTKVQTALDLMPKELETLQRSQSAGTLVFDDHGRLIGKEFSDRCTIPTDIDVPSLIYEVSAVECLENHVLDLYESQREADLALHGLPPRIIDLLSDFLQRPWDVVVRRECLDWVIAWPGEVLHPTAMASQRIPAKARDILSLSASRPPFNTWAKYVTQLKSYGADLVALRGRLKPVVPGQEFVTSQEIASIETADQIIPSEFRTIPIEKKYAATLLGYRAPKKNPNPQQWVDRRKMRVIQSGGLFVFDYRDFPSAAWEKIVTPQTWATIRPAPVDNKS